MTGPGKWRGDELDEQAWREDPVEAHDDRLDARERFGEPEGFCFECGSVTDHRTGDVYCCHRCRAGFREDEAA